MSLARINDPFGSGCAPCPPCPDVGPAFIESAMDNVTLAYGNFGPLTQLMLTPGDWDVWGAINVQQTTPVFASGNSQAFINSALAPPPSPVTTNRAGRIAIVSSSGILNAFNLTLGPMRWLINIPTPMYIMLLCEAAAGVTETTYLADGYIAARRYSGFPPPGQSAPGMARVAWQFDQ